ncbi:hypothetical protein [Streptomyces sp. NPDC088246]|uniref:hypothetical protein n=1 Tax=Streptomyces sp. NPDC088246 TaxID=3365842 RepID=UPI0038255CEC
MKLNFLRAAACAGMIPALAACAILGGSDTDSHPPLGPVPTPSSLDPAGITTPLDAYLPAPEENYALKKARVTLVNQCMRGLGYTENPQPLGPFTGERWLEHTEFNVMPLGQAQQYGYQAPPKKSGGGTESAYSKNSTETQGLLLSGKVRTFNNKKVPKGGCEGEALRVITKGATTPTEVKLPGGSTAGSGEGGFSEGFAEMVVSAMRGEAMKRTRNDPRFQKVMDSWADCMKGRGYTYDSPSAAVNDSRWEENSGSPTRTELSTATADTQCKTKVNYLGVGIAVESAYEKKSIDENAELLADLKSWTSKWIENANNAIQGT